MSEWQPIETAPKDGTPVLVNVRGKTGNDVQYVAWFGQQRDLWTFYNSGRGELHGVYPTHWMPLPAPPQEQPAS